MKLTRPTNFNEFIGKNELKEKLLTFINASISQNKSLDHVLFYGPPGVGKTSLAQIIANELKSKIKILQASQIQKPSDLLNAFSLLSKNDVLFIDEIHSLNPAIMELLFPVMEDYVIDILIGKDFNSKFTRMKLPPFTLIGATTMYGRIIDPLEERFGILLKLDYYQDEEIFEIIKTANAKDKIKLSDDEIQSIALNSKGTPRNALRIYKRVMDFKLFNKKENIHQILEKLNIHKFGLSNLDLEYLKVFENNPKQYLGLKSLSLISGIDGFTIESKIEPYLIKLCLIKKTSKGRQITQKAIEYFKDN
ncbi:Holliday junction branch migration DNA helicase RuvB [Mycoplasma bradburyae]|uniref:Holliday junction branch migration complex subunit RuvB n=2 Tax=Mycoplasma bradburyae TaxID=2963128 RepID=A0ABT5G9U4_9MOLU|nr:Holliday junction branch migration DNA helicase RuvB [Mycoplasma bradburyae]MDC4162992.1 Holliday junction branch migration DNA helicase RuvB [Mycoplasma bradburyae]MDC4181603.1 Holliday junction branch migration DNA helicase RuvB [Mycoplasma bradburyae]MDC4182329.1 Holliday junction branch migration DNA helicase RuvB [Mycoplasma bradburyae]MDC4183774.1 Holliday junction branch migration DNA helicase RuvB [Mycoplasma bradburyae]UTS69974.1 Holliday junction branch migration DNA helicase RuvB